MKRGFVFSLSTIAIMTFLVVFSVYYAEKSQRNESHIILMYELEKASRIADDISSDLNKIIGVNVLVDTISGTTINFSSKIPRQGNIKNKLLELQNFYYGGYSSKQNFLFETDFNALIDGQAEILFSNGLELNQDYDLNKLSILAIGENTEVTEMDINVNITASSVSKVAWDWNAFGEVTVNINYADENVLNSVIDSGKLSLYQFEEYKFNFSVDPNDEFTIRFGNIDSNYGALEFVENISNSSAEATISVSFTIPQNTDNTFVYYNADLNYNTSDFSLNKKIEIIQG